MRWVQLCLLCLAFAFVEALIGGTRLLFLLPSCAILAVMGVLSLFGWRQKIEAPHTACLAATGIFAGYLIVRSLLSPVEYLARTDLCLLFASLLVYLVTIVAVTGSRQRLLFVAALLFFAVAQATAGAWQHFRGERVGLFAGLEVEDYGLRASGFFICPNHLAGFLDVTLLFGLGIACWSRRAAWVRVLAAFGAVASLFGLALTASRGGYLSAAAGLLVFGALSLVAIQRAGARRGTAAAVFGLIFIAVLAGGFAVVIRHQGALQVRAENLIPENDARLDLWRGAWRQAQLEPLIGTGSGTYQYYGRQFRPARLQADPVYAHNDYLQLLAEYGAVGLLTGLAFLAIHFWRGIRSLRERLDDNFSGQRLPQSDHLALTLSALAVVATCAAHSLVDFNLHIPANAMLLAFVFGLIASPGATGEVTSTRKVTTLFARVALPAAALWIAMVALPTLPAEYHAEPARRALRDERYADAITSAKAGLAFDETNPFLWLHLGQAHATLAETSTNTVEARASWEAAASAFEKGLHLYPREEWLLFGLGAALDGLERFPEAGPVFERAVKWNPTSAVAYFYQATHFRLAGNYPEAEAAYRKSLECSYNPAALHGMELLAAARTAPR
ncbi:MAG: hypothetical protein QOF48_1081 [Verrucomicrobiota bacterium]|jgi:O-antigen ligase